jgi:hypothetical protein
MHLDFKPGIGTVATRRTPGILLIYEPEALRRISRSEGSITCGRCFTGEAPSEITDVS